MRITKADLAGAQARRDEEPRSANPYKAMRQRLEWFEGYDRVRLAEQQAEIAAIYHGDCDGDSYY